MLQLEAGQTAVLGHRGQCMQDDLVHLPAVMGASEWGEHEWRLVVRVCKSFAWGFEVQAVVGKFQAEFSVLQQTS